MKSSNHPIRRSKKIKKFDSKLTSIESKQPHFSSFDSMTGYMIKFTIFVFFAVIFGLFFVGMYSSEVGRKFLFAVDDRRELSESTNYIYNHSSFEDLQSRIEELQKSIDSTNFHLENSIKIINQQIANDTNIKRIKNNEIDIEVVYKELDELFKEVDKLNFRRIREEISSKSFESNQNHETSTVQTTFVEKTTQKPPSEPDQRRGYKNLKPEDKLSQGVALKMESKPKINRVLNKAERLLKKYSDRLVAN